MHCRFMAAALLAISFCSSSFNAAMAADCAGNPDALGTSRVLTINPADIKGVGTTQFKDSLPLEDHEVVLTFDDGPIPPHTNEVLDALASECVKATFFLVGEMARAHPALVQRIYKEGHTIGTHTEHHPFMHRLSPDMVEKEITDGILSSAHALGDKAEVAPFFRVPYLDMTAVTQERARALGLTIWSIDFNASDWTFISPERVTALALSHLEARKKGILLLHDIHDRTAKALPTLLRELKKRGYRVVHVVPSPGAVAKIEDKPVVVPVKTEPAPAKSEKLVLASAEDATKTKEAPSTPAKHESSVAPAKHEAIEKKRDVAEKTVRQERRRIASSWHTNVKKDDDDDGRKATAKAKKNPLENFFDHLWR